MLIQWFAIDLHWVPSMYDGSLKELDFTDCVDYIRFGRCNNQRRQNEYAGGYPSGLH